jgi:hypothetical protein
MNVTIRQDSIVSLGIAMAMSPYDTGNLRFNAIKRFIRPNGFTINYSLDEAFYIYFLEEGTSKSLIHQGFIANRTVPAIANYLYQKYEAQNKKQTNQWQRISREAANDMDIDSKNRQARNRDSFMFDAENNIQARTWQHSPFIEQFDTEWKRDDFFD